MLALDMHRAAAGRGAAVEGSGERGGGNGGQHVMLTVIVSLLLVSTEQTVSQSFS